MINKFGVFFTLLFASYFSFSQESTSSPYSFYGIGDIKFRGTVENRAMAGISILPDSLHINLQNPAMYSKLKFTAFTVSGGFTETNLETNTAKETAQRTTVDYLALAVPLKKFGFGFGLIPYSAVGYKIRKVSDDGLTTNQYRGKGGINKVFLGSGFRVTDHLSFGAEAQYNFGVIETNSTQTIKNVQYGTLERNTSYASGVNFNFGLTYQNKLNKKINYYSGLTFSPQANLNLRQERIIATAIVFNFLQEVVLDESTATNVTNIPNENVKLPSVVALGVGFGQDKKWSVGTEITFKQSSSFSNRVSNSLNASFENSTKFVVGGFYIPNYNSYTSYFKRVVYRGGFRYENTGLVINNKSIDDTAITLGLGLPLRGGSNLNLGFDYGFRGTKTNNLILEKYLNFTVSLSFNDKWFQRRRYN